MAFIIAPCVRWGNIQAAAVDIPVPCAHQGRIQRRRLVSAPTVRQENIQHRRILSAQAARQGRIQLVGRRPAPLVRTA